MKFLSCMINAGIPHTEEKERIERFEYSRNLILDIIIENISTILRDVALW